MLLLERSLIVFLCNLPMGATGFGDAIVLYVILSFAGSTAAADTSELNEIIFLLTVGGIGSLGIQTWMLWDKINWNLSMWLAVPTVICCMLGLSLLEHLETYAMDLKHLLGFIFLGTALYKVRAEVHLVVSNSESAKITSKAIAGSALEGPLDNLTNKFWTIFAASLSGALGGIYGTPSPPLMVWVSSYRIPKDEWRAVNAIVWLIVNLFRLFHIVMFQSAYSTRDIAEVGSVLCVVGAFGAVAGAQVTRCIGENTFRLFIIVLLIFGANTMFFAGQPKSEPIVGIATTFLGVLFYSFYVIVLDKLPNYPMAHRSRAELLFLATADFVGFDSSLGRKESSFGSVKYTAVKTIDHDEDGNPETVASI